MALGTKIEKKDDHWLFIRKDIEKKVHFGSVEAMLWEAFMRGAESERDLLYQFTKHWPPKKEDAGIIQSMRDADEPARN